MSAYAGIGSRETPTEIQAVMGMIGYRLAESWDLRTGGAEGADMAFAQGALEAGGGIETYLPWPTFNGFCHRNDTDQAVVARWEPQAEAYAIAARVHPRWASLKQGARKLHARNVHQVLGPDVTAPTPSRFVLCWTPGGEGGGGTGQALRVASLYGVKVFDLAIERDYDRIVDWLTAE